MTVSPIPAPDALETVARLAAEAALAGSAQQLDALQQDLRQARADAARADRLLSNFAGQIDALQQELSTERELRIAALAQLREDLDADRKLALLERRP